MKISFSVIIVAYKSRSFIACCLSSVYKAATGFEVEVIVIDNASNDGVGNFLRKEFPLVRFIQNENNIGFGSACNQGSQLAMSDYLKFLNPDTIVSENFFTALGDAIQKMPDAGILSAMLYDGQGRFLPESARSVPSIRSAINKAIGIRGTESKYYEAINDEQYQKIEVASGAAMLIEKSKFENLGGFDERFFMYAEDIDLSYRATQNNYNNYLIKDAPVIHLKGESTSKEGWNYSRYFYSTMALFVKKYRGTLYSNLEYTIVAFFAFCFGLISFCYHSFNRAKIAIVDFILGMLLCLGVQFGWSYMRHGVWDYFGQLNYVGSYMLYAGIWVVMMLLGGAYWRDSPRRSTLKAMTFGLLLSLVVYSLLPLEWRFSRGVILFSGILMLILKVIKIRISNPNTTGRLIYVNNNKKEKGQVEIDQIIGSKNKLEYIRRSDLESIGVSEYDHLLVKIDDVYDPVQLVLEFGSDVSYSYLNSKTRQIISSHIASIRGAKYDHLSHHNLSQKTFKFQKRIVDVTSSVILLIPLIIYQLVVHQKLEFKNWKRVLRGEQTIVGFVGDEGVEDIVTLSACLIFCYSEGDNSELRYDKIMNYSLHYSIFDDCYYILLNWRRLLSAYTHGRIER